jgi:hypothetical protein
MAGQLKRSAAWRLAAHTVECSGMLIAIAIPAFVLSLFVNAGKFLGAQNLLIQILTFLEYAILVVDGLVLLCCLIKEAWRFLKEKEE